MTPEYVVGLPGYVIEDLQNQVLPNGLISQFDCVALKYISGQLLVWFEQHGDIESAIVREKQMKAWKRLWKLRVIEDMNLEWNDLYDGLFG